MKKRTCNGCKALDDRGKSNFVCCLGFLIKSKSITIKGLGTLYEPIPVSECPKPKTNADYFKAKNEPQ
jgi:hypothetical protein